MRRGAYRVIPLTFVQSVDRMQVWLTQDTRNVDRRVGIV